MQSNLPDASDKQTSQQALLNPQKACANECAVSPLLQVETVQNNNNAADIPALALHFRGPFTFTSGSRCLFDCELRNEPCVYLWTIPSERDSRYYVHYVGETYSFAKRQREHLISVLGLDNGIFDVAAARLGKQTRIWPGLWRDKKHGCVDRALEQYARGPAAVLEYVGALEIFAGPLRMDATIRQHLCSLDGWAPAPTSKRQGDLDRALRRHAEGSIGWNLRKNLPELSVLYPDDNHVGTSGSRCNLRLALSSDADIAGVSGTLEI